MQETRALPAPPSLRSLRASGPVALFLDFDGTLVDLAPTPDSISVPSRLLGGLCDLADDLEGRLALISGRAIEDLSRHLGPIPLACAGSHGIDRRQAGGRTLGEAPEAFPEYARTELAQFAATEGFSLEIKPHGTALHYRGRLELEQCGLAFAERFAAELGLHVKRGKCVIELTQPGSDKGGAVRAFMQAEPFAGAHPVFVGDDVTDEDGFAAVLELGGTAILVGDRQPSKAEFALAAPGKVYDWLGLAINSNDG